MAAYGVMALSGISVCGQSENENEKKWRENRRRNKAIMNKWREKAKSINGGEKRRKQSKISKIIVKYESEEEEAASKMKREKTKRWR
jgi:hypothetical protein